MAIISSEISPVSRLAVVFPCEENCQNLCGGNRTSSRLPTDGKLEEEPRRAAPDRRSFKEKEKREHIEEEEEEGTPRYAISRVAKVAGSPKVCGVRSKKK